MGYAPQITTNTNRTIVFVLSSSYSLGVIISIISIYKYRLVYDGFQFFHGIIPVKIYGGILIPSKYLEGGYDGD